MSQCDVMALIESMRLEERRSRSMADIDDIYCNILLAHNIDILRHIVVLLLCIDGENYYYIVGVVLM